jgi:glycosyltransferase involved in cell wall biosynthesis
VQRLKLNKATIIFTGTKSQKEGGGIATVIPGYFRAVECKDYNYFWFPTYKPGSIWGKAFLWVVTIPKIIKQILALKFRKEQVIVYSHAGSDFSLLREFFVLFFSHLFGARTVLHIHAPQVEHYFQSAFPHLLFKASLLPADKVIVLTQWWKELLIKNNIKKSIGVVSNPLPGALEEIARSMPLKKENNNDSIDILTMCRLVEGKGVDIAIKAIEFLPPNVKLTVAGDGGLKSELMELSDSLGLSDRVSFKGWVAGEEKLNLLETADIFCLPSKNDAFPMTFVEAMCYGIPVVGLKYAGIPEMVKSGSVGFLVDEADPEKIADAISQLLSKELRVKMGIEGKAWVSHISSPKTVGEMIEKELFQLEQ